MNIRSIIERILISKVCALEVRVLDSKSIYYRVCLKRKGKKVYVLETDITESLEQLDIRLPYSICITGDHVLFLRENDWRSISSSLNFNEFEVQEHELNSSKYYSLCRKEMIASVLEPFDNYQNQIINVQISATFKSIQEIIPKKEIQEFNWDGYGIKHKKGVVSCNTMRTKINGHYTTQIASDYFIACYSGSNAIKKSSSESSVLPFYKNKDDILYKSAIRSILVPLICVILFLWVILLPINYSIRNSLNDRQVDNENLRQLQTKLDSLSLVKKQLQAAYPSSTKPESTQISELLEILAIARTKKTKYTELVINQASKEIPDDVYQVFHIKGYADEAGDIIGLKSNLESNENVKEIEIRSMRMTRNNKVHFVTQGTYN